MQVKAVASRRAKFCSLAAISKKALMNYKNNIGDTSNIGNKI